MYFFNLGDKRKINVENKCHIIVTIAWTKKMVLYDVKYVTRMIHIFGGV